MTISRERRRLRAFGAMLRIGAMLPMALAAPAVHAMEASQLGDILAQCAACHGADGVARDVETPNLAAQHDRYLFTQLQNFRSGKRQHKEMRYMSRQLTDEEMWALAQYYAQLPH